MRLLVEAPVCAGLLRTERDDDILLAALVVRKRFTIGPQGGLAEPQPEAAQAAIRYEALPLGVYGELPPGEIPPRTGTDVIVLGDAICAEPTIATRVEVRVGDYAVDLDVFGERRWESVLGALVPSDPAPFVRMPITYKNAYGGSSSTSEYGPTPWFKNPVGKGYYLHASEAKGAALPNVESPSHKIQRWDDRPPPAGLAPYPAQWGLRWEQFIEVLPESEKIDVHPDRGMYDRAHPWLAGKPVTGGPMRVAGMSPSPVTFELPPCPVEAHIQVGATKATRDLELEEILVDMRELVVDLTWRKMFRYPFIKHERREVRVVPRSDASR